MAKKRGRKTSTLDSAAIAAGSALGTLAAKVANVNRQRAEVISEIQEYVKQAQGMISGLSGREIPFPKIRATDRKPVKAAPKAKRTMSAKARKAISEAQKARWAAKKGKAKEGTATKTVR